MLKGRLKIPTFNWSNNLTQANVQARNYYIILVNITQAPPCSHPLNSPAKVDNVVNLKEHFMSSHCVEPFVKKTHV